MAEAYTLQPDEIKILSSMYVDQDRIQNGKLYSYQQDNLERYRFAKQYLLEKYPDYDLQITGGEPKSKYTPYAEFVFIENTNEEKVYKLYVKNEQNNGGLYAEDNFYESFFAEQYDAYIRDILSQEIEDITVVSSSMPWTKGIEYGLDMKMEDITGEKLELSANTIICMANSAATEVSARETAGCIEEIIQEHNLYGSFQIYIYDDGYPMEEMTGQTDGYRFKETFQNFRKESLWEDN